MWYVSIKKSDWYSKSYGVGDETIAAYGNSTRNEKANTQKVQGKGSLNYYSCEGKHLSENCLFKDNNVSFATRRGTLRKHVKRKKKTLPLKRKCYVSLCDNCHTL